jgi:DNA-binding MarR family transcriptional regulator
VDAGLARRESDQADGRRSILALTPEGHAALAQVSAFRQSVIADATAGWTAEDRAALAGLLTRFVRDFAARTDRS